MNHNLLRLAAKNIGSRRTRSWLTILGVLVGVTAVVALLSIGTGMQQAVLQQFEDIGYDIVFIAPAGSGMSMGGVAASGMIGAQGASSRGSGAAGRLGTDLAPPQAVPSEPSTRIFSPDTVGDSEADSRQASTPGLFSPEALEGETSDVSQGTVPAVREAVEAYLSRGTLNADTLLTQVPQLVEAGTLGTQIHPVEAGAITGFLRVSTPSVGFLHAFPSVLGGFVMAEGRSFSGTTENEVVVGARSAETMKLTVGDTVLISGVPFMVVGILESSGRDNEGEANATGLLSSQGLASSLGTGSSSDLVLRGLTRTDDTLFVLEERANEILAGQSRTAVTITRVAPGASVSETMAAINVAIGQQNATGTPISVQQIAEEIQGTLRLLETVLASIAAVALIVGGVGLMNTMYTAVLERTREIGILKAVGARDGQVMALFLIDSGLMGLTGGLLGLLFGSILSLFGTRVLGPGLGVGSFSPVIDAQLVGGVLVFSFILGSLSGAWPAWRASRLHPVDALAAD